MATAQLNNPAWQARWHRATAADLASIGNTKGAADRIAKAKALEAQTGDRTCSECNRPLTDPVSIDLGTGPDCRARLAGLR